MNERPPVIYVNRFIKVCRKCPAFDKPRDYGICKIANHEIVSQSKATNKDAARLGVEVSRIHSRCPNGYSRRNWNN